MTNLQGDVIRVVDADGETVCEYRYDPYGRILSKTATEIRIEISSADDDSSDIFEDLKDLMEDMGNIDIPVDGEILELSVDIGHLNPLRYRGYYYDTETGLYYCHSRYYDPVVGRFINADVFASTGQGIIGNNMFAYCGNNPISNLDSDGYRYVAAHRLEDESSEERSISCQHQNRISRPSPEESALMRLENSGVTTYNNVPVIRVPIKGNVGFSAGVIFLGEGVRNNPDGVETLMHEYGHAVHLSQIGWESYYSFVLCPSLINYWKGVEYSDYYSQPWEYIADFLGNVARTDNGQPYAYDPDARQAAYEYWQFTIEYDGISSIY